LLEINLAKELTQMVAETSYFRGIMEPNASPVREWKEQFHTLQAEKQVDSRGRSRSPERQVLKAHLMRTPVRDQPGQGKKQKLGESMGNTTWSEREAAWFDAEEMLIFKSIDVDESEEVAEAWRKSWFSPSSASARSWSWSRTSTTRPNSGRPGSRVPNFD